MSINVLLITGILNLFCNQDVISQVHNGRMITKEDINITEDDIISTDLHTIRPLLTESAWSLLNDEGTHIYKYTHME